MFDQDINDAPTWRQLWHRAPKASQEHKCSWCHKPIPVGEQYYSIGGELDGVFEYNKVHRSCYHGVER